jgi:hypothetical protein
MSVQELLDALSFALKLTSYNQIVGFRDPNSGVIIPPSIVISDPEQISKNETYEVMIRQITHQPFQSADRAQFEDSQTSFQLRQAAQQQAPNEGMNAGAQAHFPPPN